MPEFDVTKMSVAEILFIAGTDICVSGADYIRHNRNLKAAFKELKLTADHYNRVLHLCGVTNNHIEPAFPKELYEDVAKYFDPSVMPMRKVKEIIDGMAELKYDHLRKKYQSSDDREDEFERFAIALNSYINRKAKERNIQAWDE